MIFSAGTKLGPYEIVQAIGAGGFGQVYKARDTRLNRFVAIKVLPEHLSQDPELKARFEREAQTLASLSHAHICPVFDVGQHAGTDFIVMEFLEGVTLAQRLDKGALPFDEALKIALEIADALDKAHRQGVIHRDAKPSNVMLTKSGSKLLDFGLAKLKPLGQAATLSAMPTRADITADGAILGTLQYMSPEQLEGQEADARSDIFAFGSVLYEMITGRKAFEGRSQVSLMSSILKDMPKPISELQPLTPPVLDRFIATCLAKDPDDRWQTARDVCHQLNWIAETGLQPAAPQDRMRVPPRKVWPAAGWMVAAAAIVVAAWSVARPPSTVPPAARPTERLSITVPKERPVALTRHALLGSARPSIAVSPDGRTLVYVADVGEYTQLYSRHLDSFEVKPVPRTEGAFNPFFSPDGRWIGFFTEDKLKKISTEGGEPTVLCDARNPMGASWSPDGTILFADSEGSQLVRVSSDGGPTQWVSSQYVSALPAVLPDGKSALLTVWTPGGWQIVLVSLDSGEQKVLIDGVAARYVDTGHIIFMRGASLMAAPFDLASLTIKGSPELVVEGVRAEANGQGQLTLSATGTLLYVRGGSAGAGTFGWADRRGAFEPLKLPVQEYGTFKISHDGRRLVFSVLNPLSDVWIYDFDRAASTRLTTSGKNGFPAWTLDDKRVAFSSERSGVSGIFWKAADGTGLEEQLIAGGAPSPDAWSPDGKFLVFTDPHPGTSWDISILPVTGDRKPQPFLNSQFAEWGSSFSPDGRYLTYISDESGRYEIYVQPFPEKSKKWQISTEGGEEPIWSRDGRELFYRYGQKWMAADIRTAPEFNAGKPHLLFEGPYLNVPGLSYDAAPEGKRFLVIKPSDETATTTELSVVLNWFDELKRRVPSQSTRPTQ